MLEWSNSISDYSVLKWVLKWPESMPSLSHFTFFRPMPVYIYRGLQEQFLTEMWARMLAKTLWQMCGVDILSFCLYPPVVLDFILENAISTFIFGAMIFASWELLLEESCCKILAETLAQNRWCGSHFLRRQSCWVQWIRFDVRFVRRFQARFGKDSIQHFWPLGQN